jgi:hypothetical protein
VTKGSLEIIESWNGAKFHLQGVRLRSASPHNVTNRPSASNFPLPSTIGKHYTVLASRPRVFLPASTYLHTLKAGRRRAHDYEAPVSRSVHGGTTPKETACHRPFGPATIPRMRDDKSIRTTWEARRGNFRVFWSASRELHILLIAVVAQ